MSRRLPAITSTQVIRALERAGFVLRRIKGSHYHMLRTGEHRCQLTVPVHKGDIKRGMLRAIIKQAGLTVDEFLELL